MTDGKLKIFVGKRSGYPVIIYKETPDGKKILLLFTQSHVRRMEKIGEFEAPREVGEILLKIFSKKKKKKIDPITAYFAAQGILDTPLDFKSKEKRLREILS